MRKHLRPAPKRFDGNYEGKYFFVNTDIRGSVTSIINSSYYVNKYYSYDEFGKAEEKGDVNFINESTFTGAIDEGNGIYYMRARFYNANTGGLHGEQQTRSVCDQPGSCRRIRIRAMLGSRGVRIFIVM